VIWRLAGHHLHTAHCGKQNEEEEEFCTSYFLLSLLFVASLSFSLAGAAPFRSLPAAQSHISADLSAHLEVDNRKWASKWRISLVPEQEAGLHCCSRLSLSEVRVIFLPSEAIFSTSTSSTTATTTSHQAAI